MDGTLKEKLIHYEKEGRSLTQIGRKLGVTRQRVGQMFREQLKRPKCRKFFAEGLYAQKERKLITKCVVCGCLIRQRFEEIKKRYKNGEVITKLVIRTHKKLCTKCLHEGMAERMKKVVEYRRSPEGRKKSSDMRKRYWATHPEKRKEMSARVKANWKARKS